MLSKYFTDHGYVHNHVQKVKFEIDINSLKEGINQFPEFIIFKKKKLFKVYDRNCDHAGGRLIKSPKAESLYCPVHNWIFEPKKGKYLNGVEKNDLNFEIYKNTIIFYIEKFKPKIKKIDTETSNETTLSYYNHAFLIIEGTNFKFATDPWAIGPAFNNGWWLERKTDSEWLKHLQLCDFIYISHNHPDHLNTFTLEKISKNKLFIIPKFSHDSVGVILKKLNFSNILYLDINKQYQFKNSSLVLSILKSGDFRLDSGLYFSNGNFSSLIDVDSNSINFLRLPEVSLYATSYKGGASGYPLMFDNYSKKDKETIIKKKNDFLKKTKLKIIKTLKSKYFLPYASGFVESLNRDKYVKLNNKKLKYSDYEKMFKSQELKILNINVFKKFIFSGDRLIKEENKLKKFYKDRSQNEYLKEFKKNNSKIEINEIKQYFEKSKFKDNLILDISLTNDNFKENYTSFSVDFRGKNPKLSTDKHYESSIKNNTKNRYLNLKIRKESFIHTVKNKMPWEDILIGFQCRVNRRPNIFNSKFWYHFSNVYIQNSFKKSILECNNCELLNHRIDNLIYHSSQ